VRPVSEASHEAGKSVGRPGVRLSCRPFSRVLGDAGTTMPNKVETSNGVSAGRCGLGGAELRPAHAVRLRMNAMTGAAAAPRWQIRHNSLI
jgi:hypothetical protein